MSKKQSTAVFEVTVQTLKDHGITFTPGHDVKPIIKDRKDITDTICAELMAGFRAGEIDLKGGPNKYPTEKELKTYVLGLMSNWYRKGKELNGGVVYEAKNPGSRAGSGDPQLKNLKTLLAQTEVEADREEIQMYIDQRIAEVTTSKAKSKVIDFSVLPAELAAKFQK